MDKRAAIDIASRARVEILVTIVNIQIEMANCANPRTAGLYVKVRIGVGHTSDMCASDTGRTVPTLLRTFFHLGSGRCRFLSSAVAL